MKIGDIVRLNLPKHSLNSIKVKLVKQSPVTSGWTVELMENRGVWEIGNQISVNQYELIEKLQIYALLMGNYLFKVEGFINEKGLLEWKVIDGDKYGVEQLNKFCLWKDRKTVFPFAKDNKENKEIKMSSNELNLKEIHRQIGIFMTRKDWKNVNDLMHLFQDTLLKIQGK